MTKDIDDYEIWTGGPCPVDGDVVVSVKVQSGIPRVPVKAKEWPQVCWQHRPMCDEKSKWNIIAYKIL